MGMVCRGQLVAVIAQINPQQRVETTLIRPQLEVHQALPLPLQ